MDNKNILIPFTILDNAVKGRIIRLDDELDIILKQHQYPEIIANILGELLLVTAMMGSLFKDEILLTIQLQSEAAIKYIVADFESPGHIRGYANFDEDVDWTQESYQTALSKAFLVVTVDHKSKKNNRYQGIVDVNNMSISKAVEQYFYQSEQIKTSIKLAIGKITTLEKKDSWCAGGIMIQKLPAEDDEELWDNAQAYFQTIRDHELLDQSLSIEKLLYSLYHESNVTIFEHMPISHQCRCTRKRVKQIISSLSFENAMSLVENDQISVACKFCNKSEVFSLEEVKEFTETNHN